MNKNLLKLLLFSTLLLAGFLIYKYLGLDNFFSIENLKHQQISFNSIYAERRVYTLCFFSIIYILYVTFSIPGASLLTLAAGSTFGFVVGTIVVALACTTGAMFSLLISRFFLKDYLVNKYSEKIDKINIGLENEGVFYILILRLLPIFPFFLVNLLLGVTNVKVRTFYWVSLLGMLPGIMVYINAGSKLAQIHSMSDIFTPPIILTFIALALLPILSKLIIDSIKKRTKSLN